MYKFIVTKWIKLWFLVLFRISRTVFDKLYFIFCHVIFELIFPDESSIFRIFRELATTTKIKFGMIFYWKKKPNSRNWFATLKGIFSFYVQFLYMFSYIRSINKDIPFLSKIYQFFCIVLCLYHADLIFKKIKNLTWGLNIYWKKYSSAHARNILLFPFVVRLANNLRQLI